MKPVQIVVAALLVGITSMACGAEKKLIAIREVPNCVLQAADAVFGKVSWHAAQIDESEWYSMGGLNKDARLIQYYCDSTGKNGYFRVDVREEDIPKVVMNALLTQRPDIQITRSQMTGLDDGIIRGYRFEASNIGDKLTCVYVSYRGDKIQFAKE